MSEDMDEIWQLFADDGGQSLNTVEEILLFLKENPTGQADIAALFRAMHTFKGNSRVLGLGVIELRAHLAEDLIGLVRDDGVAFSPEMVELLLETADSLRGMLERTLVSHRDADEAATSDLAARMRATFDRCKGREAAETVAETAPELEAEPAPEPEPKPEKAAPPHAAEAIVFEPARELSLAEDPMYRSVFSDMARETLREMRQAMEAFHSDPNAVRAALAKEAEQLRFAADQIGMREWLDALAAFLALEEPSIEQAQCVIGRLTAKFERDLGADDTEAKRENLSADSVAATRDPVRVFFNSLEPILASIAEADGRLTRGEAVDADDLDRLVDAIKALSEPLGFARLAGVADGLPLANSDLTRFRRVKFKFYEELASIADYCLVDREGMQVCPLAALRSWCAEGASKILADLGNALDQLRLGENSAEHCARIGELMRLIFHACHHYKMEMAANLSMSLLDLFARAENGEMPADPLLQHITRSFVAAMELVFNAANAGGRPDMAAIEALFQEAASATFASSSHIEARLGLPKSFHNVLSPESVKLSLAAMEAGHRFYIVRANLNLDEKLAGKFLSWIRAGAATVISNVTVFEGDVTLFDFLLSYPLDEAALAEAIAMLDPAGDLLKIEMALTDRDADERSVAAAENGAAWSHAGKEEAEGVLTKGLPAQDTTSAVMLELIGAIVTGQAIVRHSLGELAEDDLAAAPSRSNSVEPGAMEPRSRAGVPLFGWRGRKDRGANTGRIARRQPASSACRRRQSPCTTVRPRCC